MGYHLACALPGKKSLEETFSSAIEGTMNVVRQSQKAGVKKIVVTSSFGCLLSPTHTPAFHGLTSLNPTGELLRTKSLNKTRTKNTTCIYRQDKGRDGFVGFAKEHPELEVATILPGYVIGPYSKTFPLPASAETMGTNDLVLQLISNGEVPFAPNWMSTSETQRGAMSWRSRTYLSRAWTTTDSSSAALRTPGVKRRNI
ncbi:hypothetical protein BDZ97DRAFT_782909 [Flammula alnicola]|nr:hypothetical protein BDZ97DRAFT_782909 [Flammula alnicola]